MRHTEQVIAQTGSILVNAKDLELASRSFVLTADSSYLEPYTRVKSTFISIGKLRLLVEDNPAQQQRVDSLSYYLHKYVEFSSKLIELRITKGLTSAIAYVSTKIGKRQGDHILRITKYIQGEEGRLLLQRSRTNEQSVTTFNHFIGIMFVLVALIAALLIFVTGRFFLQEKEKQQHAAEFIIANEELNYQKREKEIQQVANRELETFSYSVSHDLRAPLRHISGFVDLLIKSSASQLDENGLRYLTIISDSSREMGELIDALLTFSRLSRTDLRRTMINTSEMVAGVIKTFSDEMAGRNVVINTSVLPDVWGDEMLLRQVWINLISNALKYSRKKESAVIEIGGRTEHGFTEFSIRDNGAGFDMKYADKLFGVFQRLHKARDFEGIGIGLANVKRIVTRHGGKCWAEGEPGIGATFYFSIPDIQSHLNNEIKN